MIVESVPLRYILYADDDADDQEIMRELISQLVPPFELLLKQTGEKALAFLKTLPVDAAMPSLIILDLNMPTLDGIQTTAAIRKDERYQNLPVIVMSTTSSHEDRDRALSAGATAFVTKPSKYIELQTIVKSFSAYFNH